MTKNSIFILLYAAIALVSCQKKETEKLSSNSLTASSNATQLSAFLRYYYKGPGVGNIFSGYGNNGFAWNSIFVNDGGAAQGSPTATVFNGNIYEFHRGKTSNNLYYGYSTDAGDSWTTAVPLGNNAATAGDPSACTFAGKMFLAYPSTSFQLGNNSTPIYYSYSSDGQNWTQVVLPYTSWGDPYIFTFNNGIHILYCNTHNPVPVFTILSSGDGINWTKGPQLNIGYFRYAAAASTLAGPSNPIRTVIIGADAGGQLQSTVSTDLVNWTTPVKITTASGQLAYSSRRPAISPSGVVAIYKAKTNNNIIYALPGGLGYIEQANAVGTTDESPFLIEYP